MTDQTHSASRPIESDNVIDVDVTEIHITAEDLERDYVDVKQAGQLLNNASERNFYRHIDTGKKKFKFSPAMVTVGQRNHYLKSDILKLGELLHKQPVVIAYRTERLTANNGTSDSKTDRQSDVSQSTGRDTGRAFDENEPSDSQIAVINQGLRNISQLGTEVRDLNNNVRDLNMMMQNTISRVVEQGIDLKERYLEDRIKRTEIERLQAENAAKQAESMTKQNEALLELTKQSELIKNVISKQTPIQAPKAPVSIVLFAIIATAFVGGGVSWAIFNSFQKRIEGQFEEKMSKEREFQKAQLKEIIKTTREELQRQIVPGNVPTNASQELKAGQ